MQYEWPDGKLKWIKGSERKWNCKHVMDDSAEVIVDDGQGLQEWQINWNEPPFPNYKYIFLDEFYSYFNIQEKIRPSRFEDCSCQPDSKREDS